MNIRILKTLARQAATAHGHTLTRFQNPGGGRYHFAECSQCGQAVTINTARTPIEPHISGQAVALHCKGSA